ncbi:MAG: type IV pilus modification PilV family protein [Lentisphaeria bacterium]
MKAYKFIHKNNFTLTEILIALLITTISTVGIYATVLATRNAIVASKLRMEARQFSDSQAFKMTCYSKEEFDNLKIKGGDVKTYYLNTYTDYLTRRRSVSSNSEIDLTADLSKYDARIEYTYTNLTNRYALATNTHTGYRIDVEVFWIKDGNEHSIVSTMYKYFAE